MLDKKGKVAIFGSTGLLGSAICRKLESQGYTNLQTPVRKDGFDLLSKEKVEDYFRNERPSALFMTAGLVGGINANDSRSADFLYQNAIMILNVLDAIRIYSPLTKILYTGSTCIYPKDNPQPINEKRFMSGYLEETNLGYAVAKGLGIVACQLYRKQYGINSISVMPTNLYGPGDNYDLENGHFIAAVIKKIHNAKTKGYIPTFWGTGKPRREALYSEDCAGACIYLMENYSSSDIVNIGTGFDNSITEYIEITSRVIGYDGEIFWDKSKPDGTYEKRTDITKLKSIMPNFKPRDFETGLNEVLKLDFKLD